ncbi:MAG: hypothetical protein HN685_03780, partial [Waddliaceae bacterium]|nr:hypothetical protein [Waddliaceae bacterium]
IGFVPLYNAFWRALQKKNKEPDFVAKFIIGILATATSFAVMVGAALERRIYGTEQSSMYWLVAFHTAYVTGKLLVIPLLWATAEKLAPERYRFIIMGIIIGCISAGNIIGGQIGALIEHLSITTVFVLLSSMCIIMAAILALVKKRILTLSQS